MVMLPEDFPWEQKASAATRSFRRTRLKPISGKVDQAAGVISRVRANGKSYVSKSPVTCFAAS